MSDEMSTLLKLEATIAKRVTAAPSTSYVAKLHKSGLPKIAQKVGEEAVEVVIAAIEDDKEALVYETADLLFHLLVLLQAKGISLAEITTELARRENTE